MACELVAREEDRANLVARIPGTGSAPSLAFVGHTDVVPADPRDWTHPPFEGVVDDQGYLHGRGAIDMKNEVAARAVAMAELARSGFRPRGDLWFLAVADEEDGTADVGMRWLLESRPDIRPDLAINEGGGERLPLADGRTLVSVGVGEKGTFPARVSVLGEAGHGSMPSVGNNAVPLLGELLRRVGRGMPEPEPSPLLERTLEVLLGESRDRHLRGVPGCGAASRTGAPAAGPHRHDDGADPAGGLDQAQRDAGAGHGRAGLPDPARHERGRRGGGGAQATGRGRRLRAGLAGGPGGGERVVAGLGR